MKRAAFAALLALAVPAAAQDTECPWAETPSPENLVPEVSYDEAAPVWNMLVTKANGDLQLLQNMNAPLARSIYRTLLPRHRPVKYINKCEAWEKTHSWNWGGGYMVRDWEVLSIQIVGPEGAELDPWRGVEPIVIDALTGGVQVKADLYWDPDPILAGHEHRQ